MDTPSTTNTPVNQPTKDTASKPRWRKILKVTAWVIMAVALYIVGIILGVVGILTPDRLTPLVQKIASNNLQNADVKIDRVEVTIVKTFPFVSARIDNLTILSTLTRGMSEQERDDTGIPEFADTIMTFRSFEGGLNVAKLFVNRLDMTDVTIDGPTANFVVLNDSTTTFDIIPPSEDQEPFTWDDVPGITLRNFAITNPGPIRYYDVENYTDVTLDFTQINLSGTKAPLYALNINGRVDMPDEFMEAFNLPDLRFGLNGTLRWDRNNPEVLGLENFDFLFSLIGGRITTEIDFSDGLRFNTLDLKLNPLNVAQLMSIVPEDIAEEFGIPVGEIDTDALLDIHFVTAQPWVMASSILPPMTLTVAVPPCSFNGFGLTATDFAPTLTLKLNKPLDMDEMLIDATADINIPACPVQYGDMKLDRFALDASANIPGSPDDMTVTIRNLVLQGPATDLTVKGTLSDIFGDIFFDGTVDGHTDFARFPSKVRNMINGTLKGKMTAHVGFRGSPSMFNATDFYRLAVTGDMTLKDFYWVSGDTVNMVEVDRVSFHFGTSEKAVGKDNRADSLLRATLSVDTAHIVHHDLVMGLRNFKIGLASENKKRSSRRGLVNGMGGGLKLDAFNLTKLSDSAVVRIRNVSGMTFVRPYNGDLRTPEIELNLNIGRLATGDRNTRLIVRDAKTHINSRRVAKGRAAKEFSHIADSIYRVHPDLNPDSVALYAYRIYKEHRSRYHRVHPRYEASDSLEVMDWGASPLMKKLLTLWSFDGSLTSRRASLFTPNLPLRNRLKNIDITFNNDSINITGLEYKIGHSDFLVNGIISNMRRAFTSTTGRAPLRIHFDVLSDTIDVNQLTDAFMAGAAYAATKDAGGDTRGSASFNIDSFGDDEDALEKRIAQNTQNAPDTVMPILIPANIDAELAMKANNVRYSDFTLKNMTGKVLAYGGALNLDNLNATSDVGSINLSALYTGRDPDRLRFGFGLQLKDFYLDRFLHLVPAVDSILPVMRDLGGIISVDLAATSDVDHEMNLVLPSLDAAIGIKGDSLVLIDPDTFKSLAKWLIFKDKKRNIIDHMDVQMIVQDNQIEVYPFIFDIDRYKLGVQGYNDFDMNFKYHIAVLKSPIPFKFGINISGNPDKFKIRLGGAKFGEKQIREVAIVDTTRVNLMKEIRGIFRRGARDARLARLKVAKDPLAASIDLSVDTLTNADSLRYIEEGLLPAPPQPADNGDKNKKSKKGKKAKTKEAGVGVLVAFLATLFVGAQRRRRKQKKQEQPK